jgi:hypothetical protein
MRGKSWTITKTYVGGEVRYQPKSNQTMRFRLLDDDDNVYFKGVMEPTDTEALFIPLDEFGVDYGCTSIQILDCGIWTTV